MSKQEQHIHHLKILLHDAGACNLGYSDHGGKVAALTAAISALERKGQMESQLSLDLEPVRRLAQVMTEYESRLDSLAMPPTRPTFDAALDALPALRSLLDEVERLREENNRYQQVQIERKFANTGHLPGCNSQTFPAGKCNCSDLIGAFKP